MVTMDELVSLTSFLIVVILLLIPFGLNPENIKDFDKLFALFLFPLVLTKQTMEGQHRIVRYDQMTTLSPSSILGGASEA